VTGSNRPDALRSWPGSAASFGRRYSIPYICRARAMYRPQSMINAAAKGLTNLDMPCAEPITYSLVRPPRNKASVDDGLSLRSAALAIVGLSLLGWTILLIFAFRLFGNS